MLILASNSPRRKQLLEAIGWKFITWTPEIDEQVAKGEPAEKYSLRLAKTKALTTCRHPEFDWKAGDLVLAADTAVVDASAWDESADPADQLILGKPGSASQAEEILLRLRGRTHRVCSAVVLYDPTTNEWREALEWSRVKMRHYSLEEIQAYIASGDPFDKAGGYAIQHPAFQPVDKVYGCYPNVMGLPVCQVQRLLQDFNRQSVPGEQQSCEKSDRPCWIYRRVISGRRE